MADEYSFREFQDNQNQTLSRAVQAHRACLEARENCRPFTGGMHWKRIKGREYLYKYRDRYGHGHSLGPRSPDTEAVFAAFARDRNEAAAHLRTRRQGLAEAARFCRAALLHRVPDVVVRLLGHLGLGDPGGLPLMVIGTQALHAYEFAAGVFIDSPKASPFWQEAGQRLTLAAAEGIPATDLLGCLRRADRSFQPLESEGFAAANRRGFLVRFVTPPPSRAARRAVASTAPEPPVPDELGDLAALVQTPKFSQVVIGRRGDPAVMAAPDPRGLALHKLWLSQQEDREPARRQRDRLQAAALAELILRYLPQYHFFSAELRHFPAAAVRQAQGLVEGYEVAADLEFE